MEILTLAQHTQLLLDEAETARLLVICQAWLARYTMLLPVGVDPTQDLARALVGRLSH